MLAEDNTVFSLAMSACRRRRGIRQVHVYGTRPPLLLLWLRDRSTQVHCSQAWHIGLQTLNSVLYVILGLQAKEGLHS